MAVNGHNQENGGGSGELCVYMAGLSFFLISKALMFVTLAYEIQPWISSMIEVKMPGWAYSGGDLCCSYSSLLDQKG